MSDTGTKFRIIILPFFLLALSLILGYNALLWVLDIKLNLLRAQHNFTTILLPIGLSGLAVFGFMRKRIRILNIQGKKADGNFLYQIVATAAIAVPMMFGQRYVEMSAYGLVHAEHVSAIDTETRSKFFQIDSIAVDRETMVSRPTAHISGRNNDKLVFTLYLACAFQDRDIAGNSLPRLWYGLRYRQTMSNRASDEKKDSVYREFVQSSRKKAGRYSFPGAAYFRNVEPSNDRDGFVRAIQRKFPGAEDRNLLILLPEREEFYLKTSSMLSWTLRTFGIGLAVITVISLLPGIDPRKLQQFRQDGALLDSSLKKVLRFMLPGSNHFAAFLLINVNVIMYFVLSFSGVGSIIAQAHDLLEWGGLRRSEVLSGEYWRLLTYMILHGGLIHLAMNIFVLWLSCWLLEPIVKPLRVIATYVLTGIVAGLASISWYEDTVSVGASGAIFGLYGLLGALLTTKVISRDAIGFNGFLLSVFCGASLIAGLMDGNDNAAHIGGLISGFVLGLVYVSFGMEQLRVNASKHTF